MDPLTEKLLERARARRENLARKLAESNMSPRKTTTNRLPLKESQELNRQAPSVSPQKMRLAERDIKPDTPAIPSVKTRLQRLAEQRQMWNSTNGSEVDSPQNVIPPQRLALEMEEVQGEPAKAPTSSRSRFAALAASINNWEDDTDHPRHCVQKEKPAPRKWQPPARPESAMEASPVPAKRAAAPVMSTKNITAEKTVPSSTQPSPPKRVKFEEKESALKREASGKVGTCSDLSDKDDSDASVEQPVPAPRAAKTAAATVQNQSPIKTHVTNASPIKRPTRQSCTAANANIQSPKKYFTHSPKKEPTLKQSPAKKKSPIKKSPVSQASTIKNLPVKQVNMTRGAFVRKGATSENFMRARALLEQGCGGGRASSRQVTSPIKTAPKVGAMAQQIQDRLKQHESSWHSNAINKKVQEERQKELALIRARWEGPGSQTHKQKEKSIPKSYEDEKQEDDMKDENKMVEGQEEEVEAEDTAPEYESDTIGDEYSTEEEEIMPTCTPRETATIVHNTGIVAMTIEESTTSCSDDQTHKLEVEEEDEKDGGGEEEEEDSVNISDVLGDIDDLIVEAEQAMREEQAKAGNLQPHPSQTDHQAHPQASTSGWDYDINKTTGDENPRPAPRTRRRTPSTDSTDSTASTASSTLTPHSLATYRSQQKVGRSPVAVTHRTVTREMAARQMVRTPSTASRASTRAPSSSSSSSSSSGSERGQQRRARNPQSGQRKAAGRKTSTKDKIQALMEEVSAQQSIIHQTSQALELIAATQEYHGTKEEIEAERLLVISTQRRQACLSEIQHLKNPVAKPTIVVTDDGEEIVPCRGSVTIKDIRLPLKTQALMALDSGSDEAHHSYFVIVRCQEHVIATQILSTRDITGDCLHFTNLVCLNDLGSDFTIELLVYEMRGRCPTMDAVQSKKAATLKHGWSLTPKKFKSGPSSFRHGGRNPQSPAPAVHSTARQNSFALVGSARLTLTSCQLRKVTLSKVPFLSPLEGSIHMAMNCHTDSQTHAEGFLTMFDDCSGLGMWHRRWCVLHGGNLSFWKYPGDEKRKPPIGTIDLKECITKEVQLISRIHCARPNTFELQTVRPASKTDRDTLVSKHNNSHTITKHLLSADTKEDRVEWTTALNKTLLELRLWCRDAARPARD